MKYMFSFQQNKMLKKYHRETLKDIVLSYDWGKNHCQQEKFGCSVQEIKGDLTNHVNECTCKCDRCVQTTDVKDMIEFMENKQKVCQYEYNAMYTLYTTHIINVEKDLQKQQEKMNDYDSCDCCPHLFYKYGSEHNRVEYTFCKCKYNNYVSSNTRCITCRSQYMCFKCDQCQNLCCYCMISAVGFGYLAKHTTCIMCLQSPKPPTFSNSKN